MPSAASADDAVDERWRHGRRSTSLRQRLADAYAGRPAPEPADRAFAWAVAAFEIPAALPEALLEGFAWDAEGRRYETLADLERLCRPRRGQRRRDDVAC